MKLKFKDVLPNPNRDLKANPLDPVKTAELVASINTTGFWDNVVVRKNKAGKYELAYGHHRVAAAIQAGLTEADFIVKDLDDELMIKVMDNENREAYGTSPLSLIESVRAVVKGLAEGRVRPFKNALGEGSRVGIRYAPSFVPTGEMGGTSPQLAYTAMDIAKFLGRIEARDSKRIKPEDSIVAALNALHLMEIGKLNNNELFREKLVRAPEGKKATVVKVPLTTNELLTLTSEIQRTVVAVQERRDKTQQEITKLNEDRKVAAEKAKAEEKRAEEEHKALVKQRADALREENLRKADALAKEIKEKDERAKAKVELNKERQIQFDVQLAAKKEWEASQRVQDAYMPIRRDVENMLKGLERIVSEHNPFREEVKSLTNRKGIKPEDKQRLRKALMDVSNWYGEWAAPQFAPELISARKRDVEIRKATQSKKESGA